MSDPFEILRLRFDGIRNLLTGAGMPEYDPSGSNSQRISPFLTEDEQSNLIDSSSFLRKLVTKLPEASVSRWGVPKASDSSGEVIESIKTAMDSIKVVIPGELAQTGVKTAFEQAMFNAFATGGGAIIIHAIGENGDEANLSTPIDLKKIKSIRKLLVLDRWQINPVLPSLLTEEVSFFQMLQGGNGKIHASRVLWFRGERLTYLSKLRNNGCDQSLLDGLYSVFLQYAGGIDGAARILKDFDVMDIAIKDLWNATKDQSKLIRERSKQNALMQSIYRARIRDMDHEAITYATRSAAGYADLTEVLRKWLIANTNYPPSILFGEFSSGLDASGKSQEEKTLWNETIAQLQASRMSQQMIGLDPSAPGLLNILCACKEGPTKGKIPKGLKWIWHPLYTPTPEEQASLEMSRAQIATMIASLDPSFAPQYVQSAYGTGEFSPTITLSPEYKAQLADAVALKPPPAQEEAQEEYTEEGMEY